MKQVFTVDVRCLLFAGYTSVLYIFRAYFIAYCVLSMRIAFFIMSKTVLYGLHKLIVSPVDEQDKF
jgi:hypothetical protein